MQHLNFLLRNQNSPLNRAPSPTNLVSNWIYTDRAFMAAATTETAGATDASVRKISKERKISDATRKSLRSPNFDVWKWSHEEVGGG